MADILSEAATAANSASAKTDGFHLVIDALQYNGFDTIYGVVGIPVTDLARLAQEKGMRFISFRHEQPAAHAASIAGYLTKKPGLCLTTSAPGFLNALPALANATTNGYPLILISGSSDRAIVDLQQGDYEELDQLAAARPFAKAAYRVNRAADIGTGVARAMRAALSGKPGGVYLDLPSAVLSDTLDAQAGQNSLIRVVAPESALPPCPQAIERAVSILKQARKPLIILGKGAAYAQADQAIRELVESTAIPFLPMSMAKGILPDTHPASAATARSLVLGQADVVLLIGARLNWMLGHGKPPQWSPEAEFIQIDINPQEFDSNRPIAAPLAGSLGSTVRALTEALNKASFTTAQDWRDDIASRRQVNMRKMAERLANKTMPMNFYTAIGTIKSALERRDLILVNEGANTLDITRNVIDMDKPRRRLDPGSWGTMGVGMGYAIGAAIATGKPVVAIEGDSAFGFSGMEVETLCRYRLPVVVIVLNNGGIYRGDDINRSGGKDPGVTVLETEGHYEKIIEAFGGKGYYVTDHQALARAVDAALASGGPAMITAAIDPHVGTESGHLSKLNPKANENKAAP